MKVSQTTHDRLNESIYSAAKSLYDINAIDSVTMREFDAINLPFIKDLTAQDIKKIRMSEKVSQPVFAKFLNTTVHTIRDWEQGKKHPRGVALKLLNLVADKGLSVLV